MAFKRREVILLSLIVFLALLDMVNKPLCAVCFLGDGVETFLEREKGHVVEGIIETDPEVREKNVKFILRTPEGKILVFASRYLPLLYGDYVEISGAITKPEPFDTFDYPSYLLRQGVRGVSYYPYIHVLESNKGFAFWTSLYAIKHALRRPILEGLPEPHAALILAMTLGEDWRISPDFRESLNRSGMAHIAAISGLHISIIIGASFLLFVLVGFSRAWATGATIMLITFYILLVGFPASAVRSGIMGMLLLLAYVLGRLNKLFYALLLAAFLMLLWDIRLLSDIGFQLSFGAVAALALLYQPLRKRAYELILLKEHALFDIFLGSLAITLVISPIIYYHFGTVSFVAPIANMVILPVVPFIMALGFGAELTGFFITPLWLLLEYTIRMISLFASLF